jgi:GAF domain-containing protein/HAMP domain-containing protein
MADKRNPTESLTPSGQVTSKTNGTGSDTISIGRGGRTIFVRSLMARLVGYFLIFSLIAVSAVPLVSYELARTALTESVFNRLEVAATLKEIELNRWVEDNKADIISISESPEFQVYALQLIATSADSAEHADAYTILSRYLTTLLKEKASLDEVLIMSSQSGLVILSTQPEHEGDLRVTDTYYVEGRKGTFIQEMYFSSYTGKLIMTISTPLFDAEGTLIGVLVGNLNLQRLDQIILERAGLGETGETYLVNQFNTFVSEARYTKEDYPEGVHTIGIDNALKGLSGHGIYANYQGVQTLGVYHWVADRKLALMAEMHQAEALAPASRLALTVFLFGLGAVVLFSGAGLVIARQIARPILAITDTASKVAEGDLTQRASVLTKDEIGRLAVTFNQMTGQLQDLVTTLEQRVAERTQLLERRAVQLRAAAEVGSAISSFRSLPEQRSGGEAGGISVNELLTQVTNLISARFGYYHVGIFLLDSAGEYAELRASNSEGGQRMLARGHKLAVGQKGIVGYVTGHREARIAMDVGRDAVFFDNPDLPKTRSEMALPLMAGGQLLGALDVQSIEEAAFTQEDITTLQVLADQIAIAIENANLFSEAQTALEATHRAYGEISRQAWTKILQSRSDIGYFCDSKSVVKPVSGEWLPEMSLTQQTEQIVQPDGQTILMPIRIYGQSLGVVRLRKPAIISPGGQVDVNGNASSAWTTREIELMENVVDHLGEALESAQLYSDSQRRAVREQLIGEVTASMRGSLDVDTVLRTAVIEMRRALGLEDITIRLGMENVNDGDGK